MEVFEKQLIDAIAQKIYDKKGVNILALDIRPCDLLYDYVLIAEGNVERHVQALSLELVELLKEFSVIVYHVDGNRAGEWVVIDCGFLAIHLLIHEFREKYCLEELWPEGQIIDLNLNI